MSGKYNKISIKVRRNLENSLRAIALQKNRIYAGKGSIASLVESIGLGEIPLLPLSDAESLPAVPAIYFCTNNKGKILYISKTLNLNKRWDNHESELETILQNDAIGIFWIPANPETIDSITDQLIENFKPELNSSHPIVFAPQEHYIQVDDGNKLDLAQQRSLHQALVRLISAKKYSDARILMRSFEQFLEPDSQLLVEIRSILAPGKEIWLQKLEKLIVEHTSFVLVNGSHRHHCRYAEFWENDGTTYLRCWVENCTLSNEPPELCHNRVYSLDNPILVEPFPQSFWRYEGLDSINVTLHFNSTIRYKPKPEDIICRSVTIDQEQRLEVIKKVNSLFWFFQSLLRYGDKVTLISPEYVRQRFINHLYSINQIYQRQ